MRYRWRRRITAFTTALAVILGSLANPGSAYADEPAAPVDRAAVVRMWQAGGVLVAPAAEQALLGTDDEVRAFLARVETLQDVDDRLTVNRVLASAGPAVRAQAQKALDAGTTADFLRTGWQAASRADQRLRVNQMMTAGGAQVRAAAQRALDADAAADLPLVETDEEPTGPLDTFITSGWQKPFETDQRIKVNQILAQAPEDSNVRRLAQRALDARTVEALTSFLDTEHAVAAARDDEANTITDLVMTVQRAGAQAAELNATAKEEGAKAAAAAVEARKSAQEALAAMNDAGNNAKAAAAAARRAAEAASQAAKAAAQAMAAAQAAVAAARVAAAAASRAAAAAAATRDAANRARKAAADAAVDKNKSDAALSLASNAEKCAKLAQDAAYAVDRADEVARNVIIVAQAALDAGTDARIAVSASEEALAKARATGVNVAQAEAAAQRARRQAARANRAAAASLRFAQASVAAAGSARLAANRAAEDAFAAAAAAREAVGHAGDAAKAAKASTDAANAASQAAEDAITAANDAYKVYDAARAVDAERLAVAAEEGAEAAGAELSAYQEYQRRTAWDAQEATKRDADTNRLIAEARNPATDPSTAVASARRVAMTLSQTAGPNTQQHARTALGGADTDVLNFVRTQLDLVAAQDDRAAVATMAVTGTEGQRAAAITALNGTDAQVVQFLRDPAYPERFVDDRVEVNRILAEAIKAGNTATIEQAQRALDGSNDDRRAFLVTGQFQSANSDDRVKANRLLSDPASGPELKAATQNALDGAPGALHEFVATEWYAAQQNDQDAVVHNAEMLALLSRASSAATAALKSAEEAQAVAATARGKYEEARTWAEKAGKSAETAIGYAEKATDSAEQAEQSAIQAVASARAAAESADVANAAAQRANQSAASARASYRQARSDASRAVAAAESAKASALAAGKNYDEAVAIRNTAYKYAMDQAEAEYKKDLQARQDDLSKCLLATNSDPTKRASCYNFFGQSSVELYEANLNRGFCEKFAQGGSAYYQNCVADSFNPSFMSNRAMDILGAGLIVWSTWLTGAVGGIGLTSLAALAGIACFAVCTTAAGVLSGAEGTMGVGGLFMTWAEGALVRYAAGGIWGGMGVARLLGPLKSSLNKIRIPAIFERVYTSEKAIDANFARLVSKRYTPCGPPNSFTAGTPVLLADGTSRAIEDIQVNDRVLATDPTTGKTVAQPVTALITGTGTKELVDLTVDVEGDRGAATAQITATTDHPFWVADVRAWRDAGDLEPDQWLRTSAGTWVQISALQHRSQLTTVHNLTVDNLHTFYVLAGRTSLLVHNNDCGPEIGTPVDYWDPSNDLVNAVHNARLRGETYKDRVGNNWGAARLSDGSIIVDRSRNGEHAEYWLIQAAKNKSLRVTDLYSERAPCADACKALIESLGYEVNVTWSWRWNGATKAETDKIRADTLAEYKAAMKELTLLWKLTK